VAAPRRRVVLLTLMNMCNHITAIACAIQNRQHHRDRVWAVGFLNRDLKIRRESLERHWDAWERLNTEGQEGESQGLARPRREGTALRQVVEDEANALTGIGNSFMIGHCEVGKVPVATSREGDYFFQRLFSLIHPLLRATGRGK
jgi:hypothetical protein